ncbi:MAG: FtsX-like permease family protein [Candidatus Limnocylindrales bacterium]
MRGLVPYAWRSLVARPARTLLSTIGVAIGVAVLVAALAVTAGLDASIDRTVASIVGRADLRVSAFTESGLSAETVTALDAVPGVALTAPAIERRSFIGSAPGRPTTREPVTVLGIDPAREPRVRDLSLARGAPLEGLETDDALITENLASAEALDVGDELVIYGAGAPLRLRIVGVLVGDGPALGSSGRTVVLPINTAASLNVADGGTSARAATPSGITRVDVVLAAGADPDAVTAAIGQALVREPYVLAVPRDIAASMRASTADIRSTMALLAAITLFAAAFLILNTLAMTVVERIRELALLRAAGASRGQVVRVIFAQGLALGISGSVMGLVFGAALAQLTAAWLRASGTVNLDGPVVTLPVLAAGLVAGVLITLVASIEPAALRVRSDPAAAIRASSGWLIVVVALVGGLSIVLLPAGSEGPLGPGRAVAVYAILLLAVLLTPVLLGPLGRVVGLPFAILLRLEERLARAAISRDRGRTTLTVGALVIGLAMVVALGAVAANARVAATAWLFDVVPGDEILTAIAPEPTGPGTVEEELAAIEGVLRATPIASFDLAYAGTRLEAVAFHGHDFAADGRLTFIAGDRAAAFAAVDQGGAVILPRARAEHMRVGVDDVIAVATTSGLVELRVVGVVDRSFPGRTGEAALVGWTDATERFGMAGADVFVVRYVPGREAEASVAVHQLAIQRALTAAPVSQVEGAVGDALDRVFGLLDLLALASVLIAALGIVNTLSMDTWERVRELGMLRAAGMSRRQVWRSVLVEAGILGAIGATVGSLAGIAIGVLLVATAGGRLEDGIQLPGATILLAMVLGIALAMLAAAQPARIAGQRSIVSAVHGE